MQYQFHAEQSDDITHISAEEAAWVARINEIEALMKEVNRRQKLQHRKSAHGGMVYQGQISDEKKIRQIKGALIQLKLSLKAAANAFEKKILQVRHLEKLIKLDKSLEDKLKNENEDKFEDDRHRELKREMDATEEEMKKEEIEYEAEIALEEAEVEGAVEEELQLEAIIERQHEVQQIEAEEEQEAETHERQPLSKGHEEVEYANLPKKDIFDKIEVKIHELGKPQEIQLTEKVKLE